MSMSKEELIRGLTGAKFLVEDAAWSDFIESDIFFSYYVEITDAKAFLDMLVDSTVDTLANCETILEVEDMVEDIIADMDKSKGADGLTLVDY